MDFAVAGSAADGTSGGRTIGRSRTEPIGGAGGSAQDGSVRRSERYFVEGRTGSETLKLGDLEFHILVDGKVHLDGGAMFGVVPKVLWEKKAPADARNRIEMALNCLLVKAGGKNILVETGAGGKMSPKIRGIFGLAGRFLNDLLREYGLDVTEINIVVNTHLHFDHCGGNTRVAGDKLVATYPNARYVVQRGEFEHARRPNERDQAS